MLGDILGDLDTSVRRHPVRSGWDSSVRRHSWRSGTVV